MATNWKNLTPEQREVINAKRRERYAQLPPDVKAPILEKVRKRQETLTPEQREARRAQQRDGAKYDTSNWIARIERKMERHKAHFWRKLTRIQKWADEGGKYPWPALQDKCAFTEAYFKAMCVLGRKCNCCGAWEQFDNYWRITRRDDFLAFVPRTVKSMEACEKNPKDYEVLCLKCARDLRFFTFCWIFSPVNGRDGYSKARIAGPEYAAYEDRWPEMYPAGWEALTERIKSGKIKSLTCQMLGPDGRYMDTFIKINRFHYSNGEKPQPLMWVLCEEMGQFYANQHPSVDVTYWGCAGDPRRDFYGSRKRDPADLLITEGLKAWISAQAKTPPLGQS